MFKKKNILEHCLYFEDQELSPMIQPIKNFVPDWYKKSARYVKRDEISGKVYKISPNEIDSLPVSPGLKYCVPFLESLLVGYALPLPFEIMVKQTENGPIISWNNEEQEFAPVGKREDNDVNLLPVPPGYSDSHFVWFTKNIINIPKGFSIILGHPLNRYDLPFITLSGIIDSTILHEGQVPFFIKKDFEGIIPAGTPIAQIIPFKKEDWTSKLNVELRKSAQMTTIRSKVARLWYKNNVYQKKNYD